MNWKGSGKWQLWPNLRYYSGICLGGWRKPMKNVRIVGVAVSISRTEVKSTAV
jgi:hypothetical protein